MRSLIIGSGDFVDLEQIKQYAKNVDYIIAVDGGADYCAQANIKPHLLIGDLDSIDADSLKFFQNNNIQLKKFPAKKDKTDMELAVNYALELGVTEIIITGATGKRLDHTIANIMLLYPLLKKGIKAVIVDSHNKIELTDNQLSVDQGTDQFVSIIPFLNDLKGVSLKGFEYDTDRADFPLAKTLGVSNKAKNNRASIDIEKGIALVIQSRDA